MSAAGEVFQQFYGKLVKILPMNDAIFVADLYSNHLLPGDLKDQLNSKVTSADKATHLLDSVIKPSVTSSAGSSFDELLNVMEDSEYPGVKDLAKLIRTNLRETASTDNG